MSRISDNLVQEAEQLVDKLFLKFKDYVYENGTRDPEWYIKEAKDEIIKLLMKTIMEYSKLPTIMEELPFGFYDMLDKWVKEFLFDDKNKTFHVIHQAIEVIDGKLFKEIYNGSKHPNYYNNIKDDAPTEVTTITSASYVGVLYDEGFSGKVTHFAGIINDFFKKFNVVRTLGLPFAIRQPKEQVIYAAYFHADDVKDQTIRDMMRLPNGLKASLKWDCYRIEETHFEWIFNADAAIQPKYFKG